MSRFADKARRKTLSLQGICQSCERRVVCKENKNRCSYCRSVNQESRRRLVLKNKKRVFNSYGGCICVCCGETQLVFLQLDHVNGGGNKHRGSIGPSTARVDGSEFYRWIIRNNFPPGFQVLCANCNFGKALNGICPHKSVSVQEVQSALHF